MRIILDGVPIEYEAGDNLLVAMFRNGQRPTDGGCLCLGGDCPHCVATVDGVSYVRTCQVAAKPGMVVKRHPTTGEPPLPVVDSHSPPVAARNIHCDVVIIGAGESGQAVATETKAAGKHVVVVEAKQGQEAIGIYVGPLVVVRTDAGMWHLHPSEEVIVATGAAEIQPVVPGSHLAGLVTARAATQLAAVGIDLGHVVAIGIPPDDLDVAVAEGDLVRFEGADRVEAVVVRNEYGKEQRLTCDTVSLGLGLHPRDALRRMGHDLAVSSVGEAARESDIPPCPTAGMVCPCSGVTVEELDSVWERGFHEMELVKRATLAGTGTCQGSACLPYLRSFLADRGAELQAPFTARPVTRQLTIGEISAGAHHQATARTALDAEHRRLGAQMERSGGWWRPWTYGDTWAEYWAVREAVSIMDVSTLGKMIVSGPDALALLERLYPTQVSTIKAGRSRYVLMLDERGYLMDDGLISKESDTRYALTFTSGGVNHAEMWLRDWAASWKLNVRLLNQTMNLGAINVTGPLANQVLKRAGLSQPPRFMGFQPATIAGIACTIFRLSFTGELSYELHHAAADSVKLWRTLLDLGADLGIKPHGLEALLKLRLEKGHIIVGQDTDFDSTPRRVDHEWAVKLSKSDFIGRQAVLRTNKVPLDKKLVGLEMEGDPPIEGAVIWHNGNFVGHLTSSTYSPILGKSVMLGWLYLVDGILPETVTIDDRPAQRVSVPFYDKEATRARA